MTRKKGLRALFFVATLLLATYAAMRLWPQPESGPPHLWVFYARVTGGREILYGRQYSPSGKALGPSVRIGRLGLVQQVEVATPGVHHSVWVTLGHEVDALQGRHVVVTRLSPKNRTVLSVKDVAGSLYAVVENPAATTLSIDIWHHQGWHPLRSGLPLGITSLVTGPAHSLWALSALPDEAVLTEIVGGHQVTASPPFQPQGTVGFAEGRPVLPYAFGSNGFGYWTGTRHIFYSVYQAAISVTDTTPLWGLSVRGMVPFRRGQFDWADIVSWPQKQATTPTVIDGSGPWVAVLDGFSQGEWFNIETGKFGPAFQIKTPWWAVVRAASLGS